MAPILVAGSLMLTGMAAAEEAKDRYGDPLPAGAVQRLGTLRMRYDGVGGLAYLPDGRGVVLTGAAVEIHDLATGERQSRTTVSKAGLTSVQVRADGKALLLGDNEGTVREWDPIARKELRAWQTGQNQLRTACYSPDGKRVLTAANAPQGLKEWDLETGRELISIKSGMVSIRAGAIYGPEAKSAILGGGYDHNLERWDLATGQLIKKWCSIYEAKHMALSPDGKSLTVGLEDRATEWSLETYQVVRHFKHCPGEAARIFQIAYLPGSNEVLCGGRDGTIHRWSRESGERAFSWRPHQSIVAPFAVSPDGKWLFSYGTGRLEETSIATGEPRLKWDRHAGSIEAAAFLPSGRQAVTGSSDETLQLWDVVEGKSLRVIAGARLGAFAVAVSADGKRTAAGCKDGVVREYALPGGELLYEYRGHLGYIRAVCYGRAGRLASSADDGSIRVWESGKPEAAAVLQGHRGGVLDLDLAPGGKHLISCGRDGTVRLWDVATRQEVRRFAGHAGWVTVVRFTPDGAHAVSGGRDGRIYKWDLAGGKRVLEMAAGSTPSALACSPDGATLFAAAGDGRVRAFDLKSGEARDLGRHAQAIGCVAVSPDGTLALSGSQDTTALVWRASAEPVKRAVARELRLPPLPLAPGPMDAPGGETYGCEANPTGDPIGGGEGYRDIKTTGEFVVRSLPELLDALKGAKAGQTIFVPDGVEIDMTGQVGLAIPAGVTLAGTRGLKGSPGPRLFTTQRATSPLFRTTGDNTRITGLRIEGPYAGPERIPFFAQGLSIAHHGCEVDNCEVYNWNCVGIGVGSGGDVHIHHNSIHHCQLSGYGYGVVTGQANCFIIANKFDWCRHDIASSGSPGDCYEAAWNLVGENATSHRFDMHGGSDRGDGTEIAGDWMRIHHNTFLDGKRAAVVIRGVPSQGAEIHHNRFAQPTAKAAVSSGGNTKVHRNVCGPDGKVEE